MNVVFVLVVRACVHWGGLYRLRRCLIGVLKWVGVVSVGISSIILKVERCKGKDRQEGSNPLAPLMAALNSKYSCNQEATKLD